MTPSYKHWCTVVINALITVVNMLRRSQWISVISIHIKVNVSLFVPIGAHTVHPIAMKLSQVVVNMLAVVLEI